MSYKHVQQSWTQGCRQLCHWAASSLPRPLSSLRLELTALLRGGSHILPDLLDVVPASLWSTGPAPAVDKEPKVKCGGLLDFCSHDLTVTHLDCGTRPTSSTVLHQPQPSPLAHIGRVMWMVKILCPNIPCKVWRNHTDRLVFPLVHTRELPGAVMEAAEPSYFSCVPSKLLSPAA